MGSAMLMGERVQRRESCDARRSEVGAYLYKTVMCVKSSCVGRMSGRARVRRSEDTAERVVRSQWSGPNRSDAHRTMSRRLVWTRTVVNKLQTYRKHTRYRQEGKRRIAYCVAEGPSPTSRCETETGVARFRGQKLSCDTLTALMTHALCPPLRRARHTEALV